MHVKRLLALVVVLELTMAAFAAAQETTGTISGRLVDAQGLAVPGVTVTVTGGQGTRTTVTDSEGRYSIPFLVPGTYSVKAELAGFKPIEQRDVQVQLGRNADVSATLQIAGAAEAISVTGSASLIDPESTTIGANIQSEVLQQIPVGRRFSDTLYLAPGVSSSGTAGVANPSVSGASGLENAYIVDGVNITNAGYGALGSYSITFGSLGNGTPYDFMQEVQVKTGGYEAEFGQSTGGVVNVVTKSGSNNFSGSAFAYARTKSLESAWTQVDTPNGSVNTRGTSLMDGGFTFGGPVVHDKLFFFGALDPQRETRTMVAPAGFPLESLGEVDRERQVLNYAAKATYDVAPGHRFDFSFFGDPANGAMGPQRTTALLRTTTSAYSELERYGGNNQAVRYQGVMSPRFLVEAAYSRADNTINEVPSVDEWSITDRRVTPNIVSGGIGSFEAGNKSLNNQYQASATNLFTGGGSHEVKYGALVQDVAYNQVNDRTGPTFITPAGDMTATGASIQILSDPTYGSIYRVTRANLNLERATSQLNMSGFLQDTWRVGRLTINPGVRYDQQHLTGTLADFTLKNNWSPRLGVTYDPTGTGRSKIYGHYGRYYAQVPNDLAARALSADAGIGADYFDPNLTQPVPDGVLALGTTTHYSIAGASSDLIDPNVKSSYYNEYLIGYDFQMFGSTLGVRYVHRNIGRVLEDVSAFPIVAADLGIPGADSVDYTLTNPGPDTPTAGGLGASFEKPIHDYDAVEFTMTRRFADRWSLTGSYRWSRLWGTYEGFYRDDNGQSDPGISSLFDFPTNDPSYTAIGVPQFGYRGDVRYLGALGAGPLPLDRPHQVKLFGNYLFPFGLNLGTSVQVGSGKPLTPLAANPNINYQNGGEIPEAPRGSGIMTVDGFKTRAPFQRQVDARADYSFRFGPRRLTLIADVFNVFNWQVPYDYDTWTESTFGALNPNFGYPTTSAPSFGNAPQIQAPRQVRLGVRVDF